MLKILEADSYAHAEKFKQDVWSVFFIFSVSGLVSFRIHSGEKNCEWNPEGPFLAMLPEPFSLDFEYNGNRENYVIVCAVPGLEWDRKARKIFLNNEEVRIEVQPVIPVAEKKISSYRKFFREIVTLARSPLPVNRLSAQYKLMSLLPAFLSSGNTAPKELPYHITACLKAFDQDPCCRRTFREIALEIGCSQVHLRRLFLSWLHLDPGEYRARLRYSKICELLKQRDLSQKEVADLAGMRNVTHLHMFVRKRSGLTVNQLRSNLPH